MTVNKKCFLFLCSSTELLVVHLCSFDESEACTAMLDMNTVTGIRYPSDTQVNMTYVVHYDAKPQNVEAFLWEIIHVCVGFRVSEVPVH